MQNDRFKPPQAELAETKQARRPGGAWVAWLLAGICVLLGAAKIALATTVATRSGLGLTTIYMLCISPALWCVLGYLLFRRSRHALAVSLVAIAVPYLLDPWLRLMLEQSTGFGTAHLNYWNAVSLAVKSMSPEETVLYAAVLGYAAWDYRERFARWRQA